jgi:hypothetical protein
MEWNDMCSFCCRLLVIFGSKSFWDHVHALSRSFPFRWGILAALHFQPTVVPSFLRRFLIEDSFKENCKNHLVSAFKLPDPAWLQSSGPEINIVWSQWSYRRLLEPSKALTPPLETFSSPQPSPFQPNPRHSPDWNAELMPSDPQDSSWWLLNSTSSPLKPGPTTYRCNRRPGDSPKINSTPKFSQSIESPGLTS